MFEQWWVLKGEIVMKTYALFNYDYLFSDHLAKASIEARFLYIKMNFYATNGFVPNVLQIVDSLGFTKDALYELINLDEVLIIPNREEVFITAFYLHNKGANRGSWVNTPYGTYWKGKLWIKENGIATLKKKTDVESWQKIVEDIDNAN